MAVLWSSILKHYELIRYLLGRCGWSIIMNWLIIMNNNYCSKNNTADSFRPFQGEMGSYMLFLMCSWYNTYLLPKIYDTVLFSDMIQTWKLNQTILIILIVIQNVFISVSYLMLPKIYDTYLSSYSSYTIQGASINDSGSQFLGV